MILLAVSYLIFFSNPARAEYYDYILPPKGEDVVVNIERITRTKASNRENGINRPKKEMLDFLASSDDERDKRMLEMFIAWIIPEDLLIHKVIVLGLNGSSDHRNSRFRVGKLSRDGLMPKDESKIKPLKLNHQPWEQWQDTNVWLDTTSFDTENDQAISGEKVKSSDPEMSSNYPEEAMGEAAASVRGNQTNLFGIYLQIPDTFRDKKHREEENISGKYKKYFGNKNVVITFALCVWVEDWYSKNDKGNKKKPGNWILQTLDVPKFTLF